MLYEAIKTMEASFIEEVARTTRIYIALKELQAEEVTRAKIAIRSRNAFKYADSEARYRVINTLIETELSDTEQHLGEYHSDCTFPKWPYDNDEDTYVLQDEQPQVFSPTGTYDDVPF